MSVPGCQAWRCGLFTCEHAAFTGRVDKSHNDTQGARSHEVGDAHAGLGTGVEAHAGLTVKPEGKAQRYFLKTSYSPLEISRTPSSSTT